MFCDVEYVFDHQKNKCILRKRRIEFVILYKILLVIVFLNIILILSNYIIKDCKKGKDDDNDSNEEELVDISENTGEN